MCVCVCVCRYKQKVYGFFESQMGSGQPPAEAVHFLFRKVASGRRLLRKAAS